MFTVHLKYKLKSENGQTAVQEKDFIENIIEILKVVMIIFDSTGIILLSKCFSFEMRNIISHQHLRDKKSMW